MRRSRNPALVAGLLAVAMTVVVAVVVVAVVATIKVREQRQVQAADRAATAHGAALEGFGTSIRSDILSTDPSRVRVAAERAARSVPVPRDVAQAGARGSSDYRSAVERTEATRVALRRLASVARTSAGTLALSRGAVSLVDQPPPSLPPQVDGDNVRTLVIGPFRARLATFEQLPTPGSTATDAQQVVREFTAVIQDYEQAAASLDEGSGASVEYGSRFAAIRLVAAELADEARAALRTSADAVLRLVGLGDEEMGDGQDEGGTSI